MSGNDWSRERERASLPLLRVMTWISLRCGRRVGRVLLRLIALYFVLFAPGPRRASRAYLNRALGREATWADGYRHVFAFATTIHDRVYLLNDRYDLFDFEIHGSELIDQAHLDGQGAFLLGAHLGSFEAIREVGRRQPELIITVTMYEENARKINAILESINPALQANVIGLGHVDSMLRVREKLDAGGMIGILADRTLPGHGKHAARSVPFLGEPAMFPLGPLRMAAMLKRRVIFMTGLYRGGNRYEIHFETLTDFTDVPRNQRDATLSRALTDYVALVEKYCRTAPYNWFNYFDFWQMESGTQAGNSES
jgi:predicted LPLAT superfamily acyltransferase